MKGYDEITQQKMHNENHGMVKQATTSYRGSIMVVICHFYQKYNIYLLQQCRIKFCFRVALR